MTLVVVIVNFLAFGSIEIDGLNVMTLGLYCVLISGAISFLFGLVRPGQSPIQAAGSDQDIRLMQRLPAQKRGPLISLSVADHYVEVTTARGKELVLMRLSDAIGEVEAIAGLQIHRSHWVALEGIDRVERTAGKVLVMTKSGDSLPVSRSYFPELKARGLTS